MRISDWSSDVCSSDLQGGGGNYSAPSHVHFHNCRRLHLASYYLSMIEQGVGRQSMLIRNFIPGEETELRRVFMSSVHELARGFYTPRSEEHTYELQSLITNSSAVISLNKKTTT